MAYLNYTLSPQLKSDEISVWISSVKLSRVQVRAVKPNLKKEKELHSFYIEKQKGFSFISSDCN